LADWRSELLTYIGARATSSRLQAIDLWARSEAQPSHLHNPLGAAEFDDGAQRWLDRDRIVRFDNIQQATAQYSHLIHQPHFVELHLALRDANTLGELWQGISVSGWRPLTYQSGRYPVLLFRQGVSPGVPIAPPVEPISEQAHDIFVAWKHLATELRHHTPRQLAIARHWSRRMHSAVR
jgi:hypothetical protein